MAGNVSSPEPGLLVLHNADGTQRKLFTQDVDYYELAPKAFFYQHTSALPSTDKGVLYPSPLSPPSELDIDLFRSVLKNFDMSPDEIRPYLRGLQEAQIKRHMDPAMMKMTAKGDVVAEVPPVTLQTMTDEEVWRAKTLALTMADERNTGDQIINEHQAKIAELEADCTDKFDRLSVMADFVMQIERSRKALEWKNDKPKFKDWIKRMQAMDDETWERMEKDLERQENWVADHLKPPPPKRSVGEEALEAFEHLIAATGPWEEIDDDLSIKGKAKGDETAREKG